VDVLADKKAEDITLLDISELTLLTDYFIICTGTSERQLQALASSVREELKKAQRVIPLSVEGQVSSGWVLMDYGSVVVHLFAPEIRAFYDLEDLWREGRVVVRIQ
jgi:ribosome-associated protein